MIIAVIQTRTCRITLVIVLGELVQTTAGKWITCADFKNGSVGFCDQRKQVAESVYNACKTPYLRVARGVAVRLRYGLNSPPVAGVTPG